MKILFDHQIFSYERFGGISRYFAQLITHCQTNQNCHADLSLKYSDNIYLNALDNINVKPFFNSINFRKKPGILNIVNIQHSIRNLKNQDFDIFHPTFYNPYFLEYIGSKPFVLTVHDMITELFPDMFPGQKKISDWKNKLIPKADKIITVSESSKKDIIRLCGINEAKIEVVYHGSFLNLSMVKETAPFRLPDTYLLFVGKRSFYKNFKRFVVAVAPLLNADRKLHIVCTGGLKFTPDEKKLFNTLNISQRVVRIVADDNFLPTVYQKAAALILPSLYEGFGIPVLEAFSCGCPAIISNTGSLKEVGGDAVLYFNPEDESDMRKPIERILTDNLLAEELRQKGFERIKHFSWEKTAQQTIQLYASVLPARQKPQKVNPPIRILYDHQIFSYEKYGGISRYFAQLIKYCQTNYNCAFDLSLKYSNNLYLKDIAGLKVKPFLNNFNFTKKPGLLNWLNLNRSKEYLRNQNFDIFHPTFYNPYFLEHIGSKPFVLTVHDMITEIFPDMFPGQEEISAWKTGLIQKAEKIVTASESTKEDIIRLCNISEKKVGIVYLGNSLDEDTAEYGRTPNLPQKYLLFVGKRPFYKNFERFIRAVSYLLLMDKQLNVICAGSTKFTHEEKKLLKDLEISDNVFHFPADDRFLVTLYRNALAFVFPSLYEGFGIPVLEAFSCGCPAIISKTSSLPEVGGKAVIYFDPEDETSIRDAIKKVIYDKSLRKILIQEGHERARKFTWENTALNTLKIYKEIIL